MDERIESGGGTEEISGREPTLEENFIKIEEILNILESGDTTLEESFRCYQQGMEVLRQCSATIDNVEKKVLKLQEDGGTHEF